MKLSQSFPFAFLVALVFAFTALACNGNGEVDPDPAASDVDADIRTIEIIGTDRMQYVVAGQAEGLVTGEQVGDEYVLEQILAEPGEELRIVLYTRSELPPQAMSHNLALLDSGLDANQFAMESATAVDNDYIAPGYEDRLLALTEMLGGGESDTIEFTAPDQQGEYDFICTFPGHFASGMVGELVVQ